MIQRFLYVSRLAPDRDVDTADQILRQSRERNAGRGVSGALVFDGARFCQLVEGPPSVVRELVAQIAIDGNHGAMTVLLDVIDDSPRCLTHWEGGFCAPELLDPFDVAGGEIAPQQALAAFLEMLTHCELSR